MKKASGIELFDVDSRSVQNKESMSALEAFQLMRKMAESGQFPEMTLNEINEEIRLAREERRAKK